MDKLQEIKTLWIQEEKTYLFRQLAIEPPDIEWLIKEVERLRDIEKAYEATMKAIRG